MSIQVGDHDQDSLYDLTINQMERQPEAGNGNQVGLHHHGLPAYSQNYDNQTSSVDALVSQ